MAEFALLVNGEKKEFRVYDERPDHIPHKGVQWFPVERTYGASFEGVEGDKYVIRKADPASLPPTVPSQVSPRQARLALLAIGKLDQANAAVEGAGDMVKIAWEFSTYIRRDDPGVIALASSIGIDSAALDQLFIEAAQL